MRVGVTRGSTTRCGRSTDGRTTSDARIAEIDSPAACGPRSEDVRARAIRRPRAGRRERRGRRKRRPPRGSDRTRRRRAGLCPRRDRPIGSTSSTCAPKATSRRGNLDAASADAGAMLDIARRAKKPAMVAQALNRRAYVEIRSGRAHDALTTAQEAMEAAGRSRRPLLEAIALVRLGEAQFRTNANALAARNCTRAARMFKASGHAAWEGRRMVGCRGRPQRPGPRRGGRPRRQAGRWRSRGAPATCTAWATRSTC